tara:strand:+ start:109 stop:807 length:699 start_codon:yes stop_codon:yes gene_type:complete
MKPQNEIIQEYNRLHNFFNEVDYVKFMNHGYYPPFELVKNEPQKNQASLYVYLLDGINTNNLKVLDVGCGRGGGINILKKYYQFSEIHGCDINEIGIDYCKSYINNVEFKINDAENLNYENEYFDIVINIESSHCYKNIDKFHNEVFRVLKPNGYFLYADIDPILNNIKNYFNVEKATNITNNVFLSAKDDIINLEKLSETKQKYWLLNLAKKCCDNYGNKNNSYKTYILKK